MMRYIAVAVIIILMLIWLTPMVMAFIRNMTAQSKKAWEEAEPTDMELQEIEHDDDDDEDREDVGSGVEERSSDEPPRPD